MTTNIDKRLISLSRRYSDAILDIAKEKNELDNVFSDLKNVVTVYDYSDEMREFLAHPAISHKDKKELIQSVFEGKISTVTLNLLYTLVDKNKFNLIDTILFCYENSLNEAKNILKVDVISAVEIDNDLKENLKLKLESKLKKSVALNYEIRPEIIAGLILKIKDKTIDGSMAHKLQAMKKQLA